MANEVEKLNNVAVGDIETVNGKTDSNIEKVNSLELTGATYFSATGGTKTTVTISGTDYYVHIFTANGNFNISTIGDDNPSFLVVGGGGGGGHDNAGGGGAG